MGKHTTRKPRPFAYTAAECATLTLHYASAPRATLLAACPGRTWPSIKKAGQRLGISRARAKNWTPEQLDTLRALYSLSGAKAVQAATGRALSSIYDKASELRLAHMPKPPAKKREPAPAKPAAAPRPVATHNPGRKAANTLAPLRVVGAATKTSPSTPNLNTSKAARQRAEKANKGVSISALVRAEPPNSEGRRIYLMEGRVSGAAASAAFMAWKAAQS